MKLFALALAPVLVLAACTARPAAQSPKPTDVAELAARRAQMIQWLHEYKEAAVYPTDDAGMPLSVFRDARGVRCPMAELIHKSGRDDLVNTVVAQANDLRLADVHAGPLYDWMMESGLTLPEIAMVQGAMNVDFGPLEYVPEQREILQASARAEVRGHLATAEVALRDNTAAGLERIAAASHRPTAGPIVPGVRPQPVRIGMVPRQRGRAFVVPVRN